MLLFDVGFLFWFLGFLFGGWCMSILDCLLARHVFDCCTLHLGLLFVGFVDCFVSVRLGFTLFWLVLCFLPGLGMVARFWFARAVVLCCSFLIVWLVTFVVNYECLFVCFGGVATTVFVVDPVWICCFRVVCCCLCCY